MKALVPVNILSLVNINLGAVNRRSNLMLMEADMATPKEITDQLLELHSPQTIIAAAIIAGSMVAHQISGTPATPEQAAYIQKIVIDTMYMVLDDFGIILSDTMKA